jgi:molybdopterin converting factor small subunit
MSTVFLATPLRQFNGNKAQLQLDVGSVADLIPALDRVCPGIKTRLCDDAGAVKRSINIFVNSQDVRYLEADALALSPRDEIHIIPAMAGG